MKGLIYKDFLVSRKFILGWIFTAAILGAFIEFMKFAATVGNLRNTPGYDISFVVKMLMALFIGLSGFFLTDALASDQRV